jgi:hypothetical protein
MLETHRRLYNDALAERKQTWELEGRSVSYGEQSGQLKAARKTNPFLNDLRGFQRMLEYRYDHPFTYKSDPPGGFSVEERLKAKHL